MAMQCKLCGRYYQRANFDEKSGLCKACVRADVIQSGKTHYVGDACPGGHHDFDKGVSVGPNNVTTIDRVKTIELTPINEELAAVVFKIGTELDMLKKQQDELRGRCDQLEFQVERYLSQLKKLKKKAKRK